MRSPLSLFHALVLTVASTAAVALWTARPPAAAFADGAPGVGVTVTSFDAARAKDDLRGTLSGATDEARVTLFASAGSRLSAELDPDDTAGPAAPGLALTLCDEGGAEIVVAGTKSDKTKDGSPSTVWKSVPLETTGAFTLIVRATGAGGYRLRLGAAISALRTTAASSVPLSQGDEASVPFTALRGGRIAAKIAAVKGSKLKGRLLRVERPDHSVLWDADAPASKPVADVDGMHFAVFTNTAAASGNWTAKITARAGKAVKRTGYLGADATGFVPVVKKLTPSRGVHIESNLRLSVYGRDFQDGVDVRLERGDRNAIVATEVDRVSETQIDCTVNLDTRDRDGDNSIGTWRAAVTNLPEYAVEDDPSSLVTDTPLRNKSRKLQSVSSGSVTLPRGIQKGAEVWYVRFDDGFQIDLNKMGLGSADAGVARSARNAVEAYVILFLRDLFRANETTGTIKKADAIPVCFVVNEPAAIVGRAGETYNRIDVGGAWQAGDPQDVAEPLAWGYADIDEGNTHRDDLVAERDDGSGVVRLGLGARLRALDPTLGSAAADWITATAPLRSAPLVGADARYFNAGFTPASQGQADRYAVVVRQIERCSREIAGVVAHHIGKAMGLEDGGSGPMANPSEAGNLWPTVATLHFSDQDANALRGLAVPHALPGKGGDLNVTYFPLRTTHEFKLADLTTQVPYSATFDFVGGRPNAVPSDYDVRASGGLPLGLSVNFTGATGTAPLYTSQNAFYCQITVFSVRVTDNLRGGVVTFSYRINVLPNIPLLPTVLQPAATSCRNQVLTN